MDSGVNSSVNSSADVSENCQWICFVCFAADLESNKSTTNPRRFPRKNSRMSSRTEFKDWGRRNTVASNSDLLRSALFLFFFNQKVFTEHFSVALAMKCCCGEALACFLKSRVAVVQFLLAFRFSVSLW